MRYLRREIEERQVYFSSQFEGIQLIWTGRRGCRIRMHQLHCIHCQKVEQVLVLSLFPWRVQPTWCYTPSPTPHPHPHTPHLSFQPHGFSLMVLISSILQAAFTELFLLPTVNLTRLFLRLSALRTWLRAVSRNHTIHTLVLMGSILWASSPLSMLLLVSTLPSEQPIKLF